MGIHQDIISICEKRIKKFEQYKRELTLLYYTIQQIEKEPQSGNRLRSLEKLVQEIDQKVQSKIDSEISRLITEMKIDTREKKIAQIKHEIENLELIIAT